MKRGRNEAKLIGIGRAPVAEGLVAEAHGLLERWEVVDPGLELIQHLGQGDDLRVYAKTIKRDSMCIHLIYKRLDVYYAHIVARLSRLLVPMNGDYRGNIKLSPIYNQKREENERNTSSCNMFNICLTYNPTISYHLNTCSVSYVLTSYL